MYFVYSVVVTSSSFHLFSHFSVNTKSSIDIFINEIPILLLWAFLRLGSKIPYYVKCQTVLDDKFN